jgi:hypothetical protein
MALPVTSPAAYVPPLKQNLADMAEAVVGIAVSLLLKINEHFHQNFEIVI